MSTDLISVRPPRVTDCIDLAAAHEEAWRSAYQGIIPHLPLERIIARRGPGWWQRAVQRKAPILRIEFDGAPAGYATYGRSRLRNSAWQGEIFELYVRPVYQGMGFGRRLFKVTRERLTGHGLRGLVVWALADNDRACAFYLRLGGKAVSEGAESFGEVKLRKVAYAWR
jgi:GNAT superfamily N-acetyltransferase